jgi:integrase
VGRKKGSGAGWVETRKGKRGTSYLMCWYDWRGELHRDTVHVGTLAIARKMLAEKNVQMERVRLGLEAAPSRPVTYDEAAEAYLQHVEKDERFRGHMRATVAYWRPALGPLLLAEVTAATLQRLVDQMLADGYAPSTIRLAASGVTAVFGYAHAKLGVPSRKPLAGVDLPLRQKRAPLAVPPEHVAPIIESMGEFRADLFWVLAFEGVRPGEVCGLKTAEVRADLESPDRLLRISRTYHHEGTKNREASRTVPLHSGARPFLERAVARAEAEGWEWLFPNRWTGGVLSQGTETLRRDLKKACAALGLPHYTPKQFRKTVAQMLAKRDHGMSLAAAALGHRSGTQVTRDFYAGTAAETEHLRAAMEETVRFDRPATTH